MIVLFAVEKLSGAGTEFVVPSIHETGIIGSFENTGVGTAERFYFDQSKHPGEELLAMCQTKHPDLLVVTPVLATDKNVPLEVLAEINKTIPVIVLWFESPPEVVRWADAYASRLSLSIFFDSFDKWESVSLVPEKHIGTIQPMDPRVFRPTDSNRFVPVSFLGTALFRPIRCNAIGALWSRGIPVLKRGGLEDFMPIEHIAKVLHHTRISLNFTDSGLDKMRMKARTVEVMMTGAMLMETDNNETPKVFKPYAEYVPFSDYEDLEKKLKYYINNDAERERVAAAGMKRAVELCDGNIFWAGVLGKVGISVSMGADGKVSL